jgi:CubicO group peptidase (beta-lactamase class C family)
MRRQFRWCGGVCLALAVALVAQAPVTVEERISAVQSNLLEYARLGGDAAAAMHLDRRMADLHVPGVSIAVIRDGRLDWARAYGSTAIGGSPVTTETLFSAESMSKPVTALAVLRLVEERKIDLDIDVNRYLKRWKIPENEFTVQNKVTIRELLNHTSGIGTHNGELYDPAKQLPTLIETLDGEAPARTAPVRVETMPGSKFQYSNNGYLVLQLLIEDVSGEGFPEFVRKTVLDPIGMTRSSYDVPLSDKLSKLSATSYLGSHAIPPRKYYNPNFAAGGLWSTPTDLTQLLIELQREYAGTSHRVLHQTTVRMMMAPGPEFRPGSYQGLGISLNGRRGNMYMEHGGSGVFQDEMVAYLHGDGLVIMTSGSSGAAIADEVLRSASKVYGWPDYKEVQRSAIPLAPEQWAKYVGTFGFIKITSSEDGLTGEIPIGSSPQRIYPDAPDHFFILSGPTELIFGQPANGQMMSVEFVTPMAHTSLKRGK